MKRFSLILALALVVAGIVASSASALRFEEGACRESAPGGVWVCPGGTVGNSYSAQLLGAGGCGPDLPYQFRVLSGTLPPGLSLASSGLVSGTPTTAGEYAFYVELSDQDPPSQSWCRPAKSERQFTITIEPGAQNEPGPILETASVPPGTLDVSYTASLKATPPDVQTWSVSRGTLPPGLTLGSSSGVITGTPTAVGSYPFTVQVTDSKNRSATRDYRIDIRNPLVITPLGLQGTRDGLPNAEVGIALAGKVNATGGSGAFTWSLKTGSLPTGVLVHGDGAIAGSPARAGTFAFTAQVTDTEGRTATVEVSLTVAARLAIKTMRLRPGRAGHRWSSSLATLGGIAPVSWTLAGGALPPGVRFNKRLGSFAGTPKRAGSYRITVKAGDALGARAKRTFVLAVRP